VSASRIFGKWYSMQPSERLLTPKDVAEILSVSVAWVLDHASRRRPLLPSVKLGKAVRFRREEVEEFIKECARMKGAAA
jgi:excisionase family DNA binding protein